MHGLTKLVLIFWYLFYYSWKIVILYDFSVCSNPSDIYRFEAIREIILPQNISETSECVHPTLGDQNLTWQGVTQNFLFVCWASCCFKGVCFGQLILKKGVYLLRTLEVEGSRLANNNQLQIIINNFFSMY